LRVSNLRGRSAVVSIECRDAICHWQAPFHV
jgi:hypothetical protein